MFDDDIRKAKKILDEQEKKIAKLIGELEDMQNILKEVWNTLDGAQDALDEVREERDNLQQELDKLADSEQ